MMLEHSCSYGQQQSWTSIPHQIQKSTNKWVKFLNIKLYLMREHEKNLHDLELTIISYIQRQKYKKEN